MYVREQIILAKFKRNVGTPTQKVTAEKYLKEGTVYLVAEITILIDRSNVRLVNYSASFNALDFDFYRAEIDSELVNIYAEPFDIYESEFNPYKREKLDPDGDPTSPQRHDQFMYERICAVCGKNFITRPEWVYKHAGRYACGWNCLNKLKEIRRDAVRRNGL